MAGELSATIDTVKFVCGPIWSYLKNQYHFYANLNDFNRRKQDLLQLHGRIQLRLDLELHTGRKIARSDVETWLAAADQEISRPSVEDEVSQRGCLSSCICRTRVLKRRTSDLVGIYGRGESLSQMPFLVDDDCQRIVLDDIQIYKERKEKLLCKFHDVNWRLHSQLQDQAGKIELGEVKLWRRNVEEKTGPAATPFENQFNNVPHGCDFSKLVKERNQRLEELFHEGALLPESLVVDDYSQTLGDDEMHGFEEWMEKLQGKRRDVELKLNNIELRQDHILTGNAKQWLQKVEDIIYSTASDVQNQLNRGRRPPYPASLVNRVKELIQKMEELCNGGDQLIESLVIDDPSTSTLVLPTPELQGSDAVKAEIWGHLMGDEVAKLGVWGMGGVGKTTIMEHVHNQLLKECKFKKVIWITVSQTFDVHQIQQQIASSLKEEESLPKHQGSRLRAAALSKMLETHKPYVLILDDVWERFELHEIGIPEIGGSKLVLTTRSEGVARIMDCERVKVNTLSWEASSKLFKDIAGIEALPDNGGAKETLEEMVRECDGLPLAIKTVAASMKGISDPRLWRAALNQLKQGRKIVAGTENDEFRVLKFSYDRLGNKKIQYCFLHCAMYPEDEKILKEELIEYWIDEELIGVMETRQDMKDEGHDILNKLKENCLLEFVKNEFGRDCVRMHDLVRDMAIDITRSSGPCILVKAGIGLRELPEEHEWKEDLLKVSLMSNNIEDIPSSMPSPRCPILTTLLLSGYHNLFSTIPESFFEHMPELKVLDLSYNEKLRRLPSSVSKLVKLTSLLLRSCESLEKVPSLSNLKALKKLDLYAAGFEEVPHGLEMLMNLKYLDIRRDVKHASIFWSSGFRRSSDDRSHEEVSTGWEVLVSEILPNLSKLQHLGLDAKVPVEGGQLGIWKKLESFYGSFRTWSDMSTFFNSRRHLYHYNISVGDLNEADSYELKCISCFDINICGEPGLIPSNVQRLVIDGCNDVRSLNAITGFQDVFDLQECKIWDCGEMEYVFSMLNQLSKLKKLSLWYLENLKGLLDSEAAPQLPIFSSLEEISISYCPKLNKLLPTTLQYLPNLKDISIDSCWNLEEIMVALPPGEGVIHAKLEKLSLDDLPMLRSISSITAASVFGLIKNLSICRCPSMEYVFGGQFKFNSLQALEILELRGLRSLKSIFQEEADDSLAFCAPLSGTDTVSFPLKELRVRDCPQLKKIFPHEVQIDSFQDILSIQVEGCDELEEIISSKSEELLKVTHLPKLQWLQLCNLPKLKRVCISTSALICDTLKYLDISGCKELRRVPLHLPQLDNGQLSPPPHLVRIMLFIKEEEWWESLEWDLPSAKSILTPFCIFVKEDGTWTKKRIRTGNR